tara:strand:- start:272 stop:604 length:333 start_codon:yes stop_codon:yes gene_type:complete
MPTTVHVQTRLALDLAKRLDQRAADANVTRSELLRDMLESALDATEAGNNTTTDPLVAEIADAMGGLIAKVDACHADARQAHAAAKLAGLMLLPADKQQAYIDKLAQVRS